MPTFNEWLANWKRPGFATSEAARADIADTMERDADDDEDNAEALRAMAKQVREGSGEFVATIGRFHYFVTKGE